MRAQLATRGGILRISRCIRQIISRGLAFSQPLDPCPASAQRSTPIEGGVGRNPIHESRKTGLRPESFAVAMKAQKGLLGDVLCLLSCAHHPHQESEDSLLMPLDQLSESGFISTLPALDQFRIGIVDHDAST
jgi:hypothetical protein